MPHPLSSEATGVRSASVVPVYTARTVSISLPQVSKVNCAVAGAVHANQMDAPPGCPAWFGSPGSLVAPTFELTTLPENPETGLASAKASGSGFQARTVDPVAPLNPSTAM